MFQSVGRLPISRLHPSLREKLKVRVVQEFLSRHLLEHGWKPGRGSIVREVADHFGMDRDEARDLVDSYYGEVTEFAQDWFDTETIRAENRIEQQLREESALRRRIEKENELEEERRRAAYEEHLAWQKLQEPLLPKVPAKPACASPTVNRGACASPTVNRRPSADYGQADDDYEYQPHHINIRQVCSTRGWVY